MLELLIGNLAILLLATLLLWLVSLRLRDASIIDPFWGLGFVMVASVSAWHWGSTSPRSLLLLGMVHLWGWRLAGYLLWRNWGHGEDRRYAAMRAHHGERFASRSLFTVFWLQALLLWFISFPFQFGLAGPPTPLQVLDLLGVSCWTLGWLFESIGDFQLARFKADAGNRGRVCAQGLWRYTRHPNYFGDFCVWWGFYFVATAAGAGLTVLSPLLMSFLLLYVSGVRLTESGMQNRGEEYLEYQRRTNRFFPGPPRA